MSTKPQLVVADVELIKEIFTNKQGTFGKAKFEGILKKFVGDGSVFQQGHKWLKLRKVADHVFHAQSLKVTKFLTRTYTSIKLYILTV